MWDDITNEESPIRLFSEADVRSVQDKYSVSFPTDHREFLRRFGEGVLFNHIRIFGVTKIDEEAQQFQARWSEYFLWDDGDSALDEDALSSCVIIGDTFNGDEFALSPNHGENVFYLPQDSSRIDNLGPSLEAAIEQVIDHLRKEVANYPEEEQEEWDLRAVFSVSSF